MAKRIEGPYDFRRHDFRRFADGATWELTEGEDFTVRPTSLASAARRWAEEEGLEVQVKVVDTAKSEPSMVALRFRKPGQNRLRSA